MYRVYPVANGFVVEPEASLEMRFRNRVLVNIPTDYKEIFVFNNFSDLSDFLLANLKLGEK
jgi:hypothetical protein